MKGLGEAAAVRVSLSITSQDARLRKNAKHSERVARIWICGAHSIPSDAATESPQRDEPPPDLELDIPLDRGPGDPAEFFWGDEE